MAITCGVALALVAGLVAAGLACVRKGIKRSTAKALFGMNIGLFFSLLIVTTFILLSGAGAEAATETAGEAAEAVGAFGVDSRGLAFISAALSTGLATIGAGIGVAFTGSAALGAISEDQTILGKTLIFVGLAEGTAIYGLIVSILILGYV